MSMNGKTEQNAASRLFGAMSGIRGVWLDEAEEAFENGAPEKSGSAFKRFLHSGWAVAAACLVTVVCVWAAVMIVGRLTGPGDPVVDSPVGQGGTGIETDARTENVTKSEDVTKPEDVTKTEEAHTTQPTPVYAPPEIPSMSVSGAFNTVAALNPYSASLEWPSETDEDGKLHRIALYRDAMVPLDPDRLPMIGALSDSWYYKEFVEIFFNSQTPPSSLTVQVMTTDGNKLDPYDFPLVEKSEEYVKSMKPFWPDCDRAWWLYLEDFPADEPVIILLTARWTEWGMSGTVTYAWLQLPTWMMYDLDCDRGLTVFVYRPHDPNDPAGEAYPARYKIVPDMNASDYLTALQYNDDKVASDAKFALGRWLLSPDKIKIVPCEAAGYAWGDGSAAWEPTYDEDDTEEEKEAKRAAYFAALEESIRRELGISLTE